MADPKNGGSLRILILLIGLAITASGWIWGLQFKQVADGAKFSDDERFLIELQDQLERLTEENEKLSAKLRELEAKSNENVE